MELEKTSPILNLHNNNSVMTEKPLTPQCNGQDKRLWLW